MTDELFRNENVQEDCVVSDEEEETSVSIPPVIFINKEHITCVVAEKKIKYSLVQWTKLCNNKRVIYMWNLQKDLPNRKELSNAIYYLWRKFVVYNFYHSSKKQKDLAEFWY